MIKGDHVVLLTTGDIRQILDDVGLPDTTIEEALLRFVFVGKLVREPNDTLKQAIRFFTTSRKETTQALLSLLRAAMRDKDMDSLKKAGFDEDELKDLERILL